MLRWRNRVTRLIELPVGGGGSINNLSCKHFENSAVLGKIFAKSVPYKQNAYSFVTNAYKLVDDLFADYLEVVRFLRV